MAIGVSDITGLGRLPDTSMQVDGFGRLPDTSMQVDGFGRLPDTSMQVSAMHEGVERVAGGLGAMTTEPRFGTAAQPPKFPLMPQFKPGYKPPGTNVLKGIQQAATKGAALDKKAAQLKAKAVLDLKKNDKRAAGMTAVKALQTARKAEELKFSAAKTATVLAAESQAAKIQQTANKAKAEAEKRAAMTGESSATVALRAQAKQLSDEAAKLRTKAAVTAAAKPPPSKIPSNARIAEVAAKFGVRTRRSEAISRQDDMILLATLQNVSEEMSFDSAFGGVGYLGALAEYGNDELGRLMAAAEVGDVPRFVTALENVKAGESPWAAGSKEADHCKTTYPPDVTAEQTALYWKCMEKGWTAPWTVAGKAARGLPIDWAKAAKDVASGAKESFTKAKDFVTGGKKPAAAAPAPAAPAPAPAAAAPAATKPASGGLIATMRKQQEAIATMVKPPAAPAAPATTTTTGNSSMTTTPPAAPAPAAPAAAAAAAAAQAAAAKPGLSTGAKVGIGVGVAAVGLGIFYMMRKRQQPTMTPAPMQGW
jgi:hypothetical protein